MADDDLNLADLFDDPQYRDSPLRAGDIVGICQLVDHLMATEHARGARMAAIEARLEGLDGQHVKTIDVTRSDDASRIETLEKATEVLRSALAAATARLEEIGSRPAGLNYTGVWSATTRYSKGDVVTWGGSMWVALQESSAVKPNEQHAENRCWQLAVKRGSGGRGA